MMLETSMPVGEIAIACGFADQSHLTRVFTRAMGVSPGVWRRERRR
jgi:transcriptional regulator GlxA family with amidase domain